MTGSTLTRQPQVELATDALTLTRAAEEYGVGPRTLRGALERGAVRGRPVDRGPHRARGWELDRAAFEEDLARLRCRADGCAEHALGESGLCNLHALIEAAKAKDRAGRLYACERCGAERYYSPSHPGRRLCQACYVASPDFERNLQAAQSRAGEWRADLRERVSTVKAERSLLDSRDVARVAGLASPAQVTADFVAGGLKHEPFDAGGVMFNLYPSYAVDLFIRDRVKRDDGRLQRWADPAVAVQLLAARGLSVDEAARQRIAVRRALRRFRAGRPRSDALHAEWKRLFYEQRAHLTGWSDWQVCGTVAELHFREHPEEWKKYQRGPDGGLHPDDVEKATGRVWKAVR